MEKNKKISLIVKILTVSVIFLGILVIWYIHRDNIYNFLSKKNSDADTHEVLNATSITDDRGGDIVDISASETIPQTSETAPPTTEIISETEIATEPSIPETSEDATEAATEPAEPQTAPPPTNPVIYIEAPKDDFMRVMFNTAIEIPGAQDKIEPPPAGRSEERQYCAVPLSDTVPEPFGYFKDVIFLGDSVTTGFDLYRNSIKFNGDPVLRDVNVVAVGSYGVYNATRPVSDNSIHPLFDGQQTLPEDIIAQKTAKNVFICLGLNDLTWVKIDNFTAYYLELINKIKEKSPDKNIVIMSVTPVVAGEHKSSLNNALIMEANNVMLDFAKENNIPFIDYAAAIRDSQNCLYSDLSSDGYCHLTVAAYNRLVEYLLYHPIKE